MTNSLLPGWPGEGFSLLWKFVFPFMNLLEDWFPVGCGGRFGRLGACLGLGLGGACRVGWLAGRGVAGGPWDGYAQRQTKSRAQSDSCLRFA